MTATALNAADYLVLTIFALSMLLGFLRGFLKEIMSLLVWAASIIVSSLYSNKLAANFSGAATSSAQGDTSSLVALGGSFAALFVGTWLAGTFLTYLVKSVVQPVGASLPNRLIGALFGFIRGFLLAVAFIFIAELTPMGNQVVWQESRVVAALRPAVTWLGEMVNPQIEILKAKAQEAAKGFGSKFQDQGGESAASILQSVIPSEPTAP